MKVFVNKGQSEKTGLILKAYHIRPSFFQRPFLSLIAGRETKLRIYFYAAGICHQTRSLIDKSRNLAGWEYLEDIFLKLALEDSGFFQPEYLSSINISEITHNLKCLFSYDGQPENCTLDRLEERARMLKEMAVLLNRNYGNSAAKFLDESKGLLYNNGKGYYESLANLEAFCDPKKKKITFFLKLATDAKTLEIKDKGNIIPIMDYHMQRVLLRMGCVETDRESQSKLINKEVFGSDSEIREACIESVKIISKTSRHGILSMNDFFWPLGRSCCNESPLCHFNSCSKDPCTFFNMIELSEHKNCIFEKACKGSHIENYRLIWEPMVETHYY
ncbi:MAG: hypothetical protein GXO89_07355 [Chlorobi bacterium]|nr:hypothetical protein [Chlorobiota bacterium]